MSRSVFLNLREGISQSERWFDTLVPDFVEIDSRDIPDFVKFISDFSSQLYYYNSSNVPDGTWEDFFSQDPNILALLISRFDLEKINKEFKIKKSALVSADGDELVLDALNELFHFTYNVSSYFREVSSRFLNFGYYKQITEIVSKIDDVENEIILLSSYYDEAVNEFGLKKQLDWQKLKTRTGLNTDTNKIFNVGNTPSEKISAVLPLFENILDEFNAKFSILVSTSTNYIKKEKLTEKTFAPHIALFITFLDLYGHLRRQINGITKRHLDFYFKQVLGILPEPSSPDKVNLLFEPDPQRKNTLITTEDLLIAEVPGNDIPFSYKLENEIIVTNAEIVELKTLALSDYKQIISKDNICRDVNEVQVYKASNPVFKPGAYLKKRAEIKSWPVLGQDQHELVGSLRDMDDTDIGIILGSALFYQTEAERTFKLRIHIRPSDFLGLKDYIRNFSKITSKKEETVIHELFSPAFIIDYTAEEGWERIENYSAKISFESLSRNILEIEFTLSATAKSVDVYNSDIHNLKIDSQYPLVRIVLNNFSEHHPYSFLKDVLLERVTINVKVKGFKSLKMQNNIGPLSPAIPFQPFGPQPSLGSFLDIKNTNVFNNYTKDFSFHIEWLDLPRDKGGFESYYKGYDEDYSNHGFQIGLSSIHGGVYQPERNFQQSFSLFEEKHGSKELESKTDITGVDFKKIEFSNKADLKEETLVNESYFKEGAVRIELLSPSQAFGHRLYPQIFPKAVLNNAKMFRKKQPLPNQPYIPIVKSITVDFELEYSENFAEDGNMKDASMHLFHQYPFGYDAVFPGNVKKNHFFMPQFEDAANLYIGLKNIEAGSILSLLFQMEEKNFHHTLHDPVSIKWSYLETNSWIELKGRDVLLTDQTNRFINSGIVQIRMPDKIATDNTILDQGIFWLRASSKKLSDVQANVIAVCVNAATALRTSHSNNSETVMQLEPFMIKGFSRNMPGIQNVWQLFPSYGGKNDESIDKYYVRVSERLRHKQRPVQTRDMIQVILEQFPDILIVKCFSSDDESLMILPGINLHVVLIPKAKDDGSFENEEPRVSLATLYEVKTFLQGLISPFIKIEVGNAVYEKVKVNCSVIFSDLTKDYGALSRRLTEDINRFIAPWLYGETEEMKIGSKVYSADLQMFIKTRPYVSYLTAFSIVHFYYKRNVITNELEAEIIDTVTDKPSYISGSTPAAVLIPSSFHNINVVSKPDFRDARQSGIQSFFIGEEFLITGKYTENNNKVVIEEKPTEEEELFNLIITHNIE